MKKIILIFVILAFLVVGVVFYLNRVVLPVKIRSVIISGIAGSTGGQVSLDSLEFGIFKGLVLKGLTVSSDTKKILEAREVSCLVVLPAILQKKIIIPALKIKSARIFLERKADKTFNIQDLILKAMPAAKKQPFSIFVSKVSIVSSVISFTDKSTEGEFKKDLEDIDLTANLSMPGEIKFKFKGRLPGSPTADISVSGEYRLGEKRLISRIDLKDLACAQFSPYLSGYGIVLSGGSITAAADIDFKDNIINAKIAARSRDLAVSKTPFSIKLNSDLLMQVKKGLSDQRLEYSGTVLLTASEVSGIESLERISGINGEVKFSDTALSSDKLNALVWGIPLEAKIRLSDFKKPLLEANVTGEMDLKSIQGLLKDKFKFELPADIQGRGKFLVNARTRLPLDGPVEMEGVMEVNNAQLSLAKAKAIAQEINGRVEFNLNEFRWPKLNFKYAGLACETSGTLKDFSSPQVNFKITSPELVLDSAFKLNKGVVQLSKAEGKYLHSDFSAKGVIDVAQQDNLSANITGRLSVNLQDAVKFRKELEKINPQGTIKADFTIEGRLSDLNSCDITAQLSSPDLSVYGLKLSECNMAYRQADGMVDISPLNFFFYDGAVQAQAKINLKSKELPFWLSIDAQDVKIEKLKMDTPAKAKDIAGTAVLRMKTNGFCSDLTRINASGEIAISEGKLWELNLFKGLGHLLFVRDFDKILFHKGTCGFIVQDKYVYTENLKLLSNITELEGRVKIGFDGALDAVLDVHILDENVPLSGTFKDVTQAIIGTAGRFGIIKIGGTLREPKYKFQPAVTDIIKGIKDIIFGGE